MADQTSNSSPTESTATENPASEDADTDALVIETELLDGEAQNLTANIDLTPEENSDKPTGPAADGKLSDEQVQTLLDLAQTDPELAESLDQLGEDNPAALEELVNYLEEIQTSAGGDDALGLDGQQLGELFRSGLREILDAQRQSAQGGISGDSDFASNGAQGALSNDSRFGANDDDGIESSAADSNRGAGDGGDGDSGPAADTDASAPILAATDASGQEDTSIALTLSANLTDTDGSETLSIVISGIPAGATLVNDNGPLVVSGGQVTLTADQLEGLAITPPTDSDANFTLNVAATSTESDGGATNTVNDTLDVTVDAVADAPNATAQNVSGDEDSAIALNLSAAVTDSSETLSVQLTGVPAGATLSHGTNLGGGVWSIDQADLGSVTLTPPANFSGDINVQLEATSTDGSDTASTNAAFTVSVAGVADTPTTSADNVSGDEDSAIGLNLSAATTDGSETLSVQLTGVPAGATLSHGTDLGGGVWSIDPGDLGSVTLTPPADFSGNINLQIDATSTDGSDTASSSSNFTVSVAGVADAPTTDAQNVSGNEDSAIPLNLTAGLTDDSETLSAQITGVPAGSSLSHGTDLGGGVWSIDPADLGSVTLTPPANFSGDLNLQLQATSTDGSDTATTTDDTLDLSDIVSLGNGDVITDYLSIEDDGNGNSVVKVDADGGGDNFQNVDVLQGVTGLDVQQLFNNGHVVVDES